MYLISARNVEMDGLVAVGFAAPKEVPVTIYSVHLEDCGIFRFSWEAGFEFRLEM